MVEAPPGDVVPDPAEHSPQAGRLPGPPQLGAVGSGALSVLFVAALVALPLLGVLVAPLGLIPVVQYLASGRPGLRAWGWVVVLLGLAVAVGLDRRALDVLAAYALLVVIPALTLQWWLRSRWSEGRWVALTVGLGAGYCLLLVVAMTWPEPPVAGTAALVRQLFSEVEKGMSASGALDASVALDLDTTEAVLAWTFPSVLLAYLVAVLFWIRPRLPLLGFAKVTAPFELYRSEEWLPAIFAVSGAGILVLSGTPRWVALNLLAAVLILFFVHGLAIIRAHLARWLGRGWLIRWGIGLSSLLPPLPLFVAALGLVDGFVPLRPQADDNGRTA